MASPKHPIRSSQILGLSLVGLSIGSSHDSVLGYSPSNRQDFAAARPSPSPRGDANDGGADSSSSAATSGGGGETIVVRDIPPTTTTTDVRQRHSSGRRWKSRCVKEVIFFPLYIV